MEIWKRARSATWRTRKAIYHVPICRSQSCVMSLYTYQMPSLFLYHTSGCEYQPSTHFSKLKCGQARHNTTLFALPICFGVCAQLPLVPLMSSQSWRNHCQLNLKSHTVTCDHMTIQHCKMAFTGLHDADTMRGLTLWGFDVNLLKTGWGKVIAGIVLLLRDNDASMLNGRIKSRILRKPMSGSQLP